MLIHSILNRSYVNGPGARLVVWTQGCTLRCPGCWNEVTHAFVKSNDMNEATIMFRLAMETGLFAEKPIDGITFSGGEPMQQAEDLARLMTWIKQKYPSMSIGMYTGYSRKELDRADYTTFKYAGPTKRARFWKEIQAYIDFAVMGRFNQNQLDSSRPLCSSKNQKLVLFSQRYQLSDFRPQEYEVQIEDGLVSITGFPPEAIQKECK